MTEPTFTLYDHPVSSYAQKARVALREKNLPFTVISPFRFEASSPDPLFTKANPRGEVPVLAVTEQPGADPFTVVDSRIIVQYLEDRYPEKPLLARDAAGKAKARMIEQVCDAQYEAVNWGWGEVLWMKRAKGELKAHLKAETERQTRDIQDWLEGQIEASGWLAGESFGLAEAAAAPIVHRSAYFGFGPRPGSKLAAWLDRAREWPSMKATLKEFDENVDSMFGMSDLFLSGKRQREYRDYRLEFLIKSGGLEIVLAGLENENIRFPWPEGRLKL